MKKQLFTLFLAFAATAFVGCSDDNDSDPIVPGGKQLIKVTETEDGESVVSNLTYDNKNRLTSIKKQDNSEVTNFTYDANGNITKMEMVEDTDKTTFEVTYNNGVPVSGKFSQDYEGTEDDLTLNLTYTVANGKVTEILQKLNNVNFAKTTITYTANNNVEKVKTESLLPVEDEAALDEIPDLSSQTIFTYGTKKNMYPNAGFKYVLDPYFSAVLFAKNEITSQKTDLFGTSTTITSQYTFDADGYPLTKTDSDGVTYKFEYK